MMWPLKSKKNDKRQFVFVRFHNGNYVKGYIASNNDWEFDPTGLSDVGWLNWEDGTSTRLNQRNILYMNFEDAPLEGAENGK